MGSVRNVGERLMMERLLALANAAGGTEHSGRFALNAHTRLRLGKQIR